MPTRLDREAATDLARRITLDDLHARAGPQQDADGWFVRVTWLADGRSVDIDSWEAWRAAVAGQALGEIRPSREAK